MAAAILLAVVLRRRRILRFWPYVVGPGSLSWAALHYGGLHPALALVPIVPLMPHSARDLGLFNAREERLPDTLRRSEHWRRRFGEDGRRRCGVIAAASFVVLKRLSLYDRVWSAAASIVPVR